MKLPTTIIDHIFTLGEIQSRKYASSILVDTEKYYLFAHYSLLTDKYNIDLYIDSEMINLTYEEFNYIANKLSNNKEETNNAFTSDDRDHQESLIH